jgi:voltage-gated potassium channel Kch
MSMKPNSSISSPCVLDLPAIELPPVPETVPAAAAIATPVHHVDSVEPVEPAQSTESIELAESLAVAHVAITIPAPAPAPAPAPSPSSPAIVRTSLENCSVSDPVSFPTGESCYSMTSYMTRCSNASSWHTTDYQRDFESVPNTQHFLDRMGVLYPWYVVDQSKQASMLPRVDTGIISAQMIHLQRRLSQQRGTVGATIRDSIESAQYSFAAQHDVKVYRGSSMPMRARAASQARAAAAAAAVPPRKSIRQVDPNGVTGTTKPTRSSTGSGALDKYAPNCGALHWFLQLFMSQDRHTWVFVCMCIGFALQLYLRAAVPLYLDDDSQVSVPSDLVTFALCCFLLIDVVYWLDLVAQWWFNNTNIAHMKIAELSQRGNSSSTGRRRMSLLDQLANNSKQVRREWWTSVLASLPLDALYLITTFAVLNQRITTGAGVRTWLLCRLPRLLRLASAPNLVQKFVERYLRQMHHAIARTVKLATSFLAFVHIAACVWIIVPEVATDFDKSWIARDAVLFPKILTDDHAARYMRALHWTATTVTTLGFADISPYSTQELLLAIAVMASGIVFGALLIATMTSLIVTASAASVAFKQREKMLHRFLTNRRVPQRVREAVDKYMSFQWSLRKGMSDIELFNVIPEHVRIEMLLIRLKPVIDSELAPTCSVAMVLALLRSLRPTYIGARETVHRVGDPVDSVQFLLHGRLSSTKDGIIRAPAVLNLPEVVLNSAEFTCSLSTMSEGVEIWSVDWQTFQDTVAVPYGIAWRALYNRYVYKSHNHAIGTCATSPQQSPSTAINNDSVPPDLVPGADNSIPSGALPSRKLMYHIYDSHLWGVLYLCVLCFYGIFMPYRAVFWTTNSTALSNAQVITMIVIEHLTADAVASCNQVWRMLPAAPVRSKLLCALPWEWIPSLFISSLTSFSMLQVWAVMRLVKLVLLADINHAFVRLDHTLRHFGVTLSTTGLRVIQACAATAVLAHIVACSWYLVERFSSDWQVQSIIRSADRTAAATTLVEDVTQSDAWYWTFVTLTTVGYGDIIPIGTSSTVFAMLVILLGASMYPSVIAIVAYSTDGGSLSPELKRYHKLRNATSSFLDWHIQQSITMSSHSSSSDRHTTAETRNSRKAASSTSSKADVRWAVSLKSALHQYFRYVESEDLQCEAMMAALPRSLQTLVNAPISNQFLSKSGVFTGCSKYFVDAFHRSIQFTVVLPSMELFHAQDIPHRMFLLVRGEVELFSSSTSSASSTPATNAAKRSSDANVTGAHVDEGGAKRSSSSARRHKALTPRHSSSRTSSGSNGLAALISKMQKSSKSNSKVGTGQLNDTIATDRVLKTISTGTVFGDFEFVLGTYREVSARATADANCLLAYVDRSTLMQNLGTRYGDTEAFACDQKTMLENAERIRERESMTKIQQNLRRGKLSKMMQESGDNPICGDIDMKRLLFLPTSTVTGAWNIAAAILTVLAVVWNPIALAFTAFHFTDDASSNAPIASYAAAFPVVFTFMMVVSDVFFITDVLLRCTRLVTHEALDRVRSSHSLVVSSSSQTDHISSILRVKLPLLESSMAPTLANIVLQPSLLWKISLASPSWWLDVFCSVPFDWLIVSLPLSGTWQTGVSASVLGHRVHLWLFLRMLKVLRAFRLSQYIKDAWYSQASVAISACWSKRVSTHGESPSVAEVRQQRRRTARHSSGVTRQRQHTASSENHHPQSSSNNSKADASIDDPATTAAAATARCTLVTKLLCLMLGAAHIFGCLWYFFGRQTMLLSLPSAERHSWIEFDSTIYDFPNHELSSQSFAQYVRSVYWAIATMTTVGFGDIVPHAPSEIIMSMAVMIIGAGVFATIVSMLGTLTAKSDNLLTQMYSSLQQLEVYASRRFLPVGLFTRATDSHSMIWKQAGGVDPAELIEQWPMCVRERYLWNICGDRFDYSLRQLASDLLVWHRDGSLPYISAATSMKGSAAHTRQLNAVPGSILRALVSKMRPIWFTRSDFIVRRHEVPTAAYFLIDADIVCFDSHDYQLSLSRTEHRFLPHGSHTVALMEALTSKPMKYYVQPRRHAVLGFQLSTSDMREVAASFVYKVRGLERESTNSSVDLLSSDCKHQGDTDGDDSGDAVLSESESCNADEAGDTVGQLPISRRSALDRRAGLPIQGASISSLSFTSTKSINEPCDTPVWGTTSPEQCRDAESLAAKAHRRTATGCMLDPTLPGEVPSGTLTPRSAAIVECVSLEPRPVTPTMGVDDENDSGFVRSNTKKSKPRITLLPAAAIAMFQKRSISLPLWNHVLILLACCFVSIIEPGRTALWQTYDTENSSSLESGGIVALPAWLTVAYLCDAIIIALLWYKYDIYIKCCRRSSSSNNNGHSHSNSNSNSNSNNSRSHTAQSELPTVRSRSRGIPPLRRTFRRPIHTEKESDKGIPVPFHWDVVVDIVAVLPIELFALLLGVNASSTWHMWSLLRLNRLLALRHVLDRFQVLRHWLQSQRIVSSSATLQLGQTVLIWLLCSHLLTCTWLLLGGSRWGQWLQSAPSGNISLGTPIEESATLRYLRGWYFLVTVLTTTGYGDIVPQTSAETSFVIVAMFVGAVMYAILIANISSLLQRNDEWHVTERRIAACASKYAPHLLKHHIAKEMRYSSKFHHVHCDEAKLDQAVSSSVKRDIFSYLARDALQQSSLFRKTSSAFRRYIASTAQFQMVRPGYMVAVRGAFVNRIICLCAGSVRDSDGQYESNIRESQYRKSTARQSNASNMSAGRHRRHRHHASSPPSESCTGLIEVLNGSTMSRTVVADTPCELMLIPLEAFQQALDAYPADRQKLLMVIAEN